jgi:putative flippase GtrA
MTGILNTAFGYGVYAVLLHIGFKYETALLLSTIMGVMFNYFSFAHLTFSVKINWSSFSRFLGAYSLVYLGNLGFLVLLIDFALFGPYVSQFICLPINILLSWILLNKWVYKKDLK